MPTVELTDATTLPARRPRRRARGARLAARRRRSVGRRRARRRALRRHRRLRRRRAISARRPTPPPPLRAAPGERIGALGDVLANTPPDRRDPARPWLHRAGRPAGDQGRRRHLRDLDARAGDRGTRARRAATAAEAHPRRDRRAASAPSCASIKPGSPAAERLKAGAGRGGRCGRNIWRSASAPTPRSSPRASRCRRWEPAPTPASTPLRPGTIPSPKSALAVNSHGRDRRRDARQRRQPARFRGPLGAAARQGQGPERELRDRPVPALLRRNLHARRRAPR